MKLLLSYSLLLSLLIIAVLQQWIFIGLFTTVLFSLLFPTHSLFVVAVLIDGYFGAFASAPVFSLLALSWYIVAETLRDRLNVGMDNRV